MLNKGNEDSKISSRKTINRRWARAMSSRDARQREYSTLSVSCVARLNQRRLPHSNSSAEDRNDDH